MSSLSVFVIFAPGHVGSSNKKSKRPLILLIAVNTKNCKWALFVVYYLIGLQIYFQWSISLNDCKIYYIFHSNVHAYTVFFGV